MNYRITNSCLAKHLKPRKFNFVEYNEGELIVFLNILNKSVKSEEVTGLLPGIAGKYQHLIAGL